MDVQDENIYGMTIKMNGSRTIDEYLDVIGQISGRCGCRIETYASGMIELRDIDEEYCLPTLMDILWGNANKLSIRRVFNKIKYTERITFRIPKGLPREDVTKWFNDVFIKYAREFGKVD